MDTRLPDRKYMELAIEEARKSEAGDTRVHPQVGAVAVSAGNLLASAYRGETESGEHAEFILLERKLPNEALNGATIYATLEPCTIRGSPKIPCTEHLLTRGVARVVIGMLDPNPAIRGNSVLLLRQAGIEVNFFPEDLLLQIEAVNRSFIGKIEHVKPITLVVQGIVQPVGDRSEGALIQSVAPVWKMIVRMLKEEPHRAFEIDPYKWEELVAAAFDVAGYDEVILTPRSGDHGRDIIATKHGVGAVRILGSVKAYKPGHLVRHDDVRALAGVLSADPRASKGIVTTTSDFAPGIRSDPFISPLIPYRLELMNGNELQKWFEQLAEK